MRSFLPPRSGENTSPPRAGTRAATPVRSFRKSRLPGRGDFMLPSIALFDSVDAPVSLPQARPWARPPERRGALGAPASDGVGESEGRSPSDLSYTEASGILILFFTT